METKKISFHYNETQIDCKVDCFEASTTRNHVGIYPGEFEEVSNNDQIYDFEILNIYNKEGGEDRTNENMYYEIIEKFIAKGDFDFYKMEKALAGRT